MSAIIGGGLAGLIAAHAWPRWPVFEAGPCRPGHQALLRFRSTAVAELTGIPFRSVLVRKGIWLNGKFRAPDIRLANWYAQKVTGSVVPRSIWETDPVTRWIAPPDFYGQLVAQVGPRIKFGRTVHPGDFDGRAVVSTIPMDKMLNWYPDLERPKADFVQTGIYVVRAKLAPGTNVHQTIYFPDPDVDLYRASIVGDELIAECVEPFIDGESFTEESASFAIQQCLDAFGIDSCDSYAWTRQEYGKIIPLDDVARKRTLFELSRRHKVYSLGRFATWRNILLDDVVHDISVIKRLMATGDYEGRLAAT